MTSDRPDRLGSRTVVRSSLWMLGGSAVIRASGFLTQMVLAVLLAKSDFGIWAIALSVSALLTNFRGGGMLQWLILGGARERDARRGVAFWGSLGFNTALGAVIVAVAVPVGELYGDAAVATVLQVSGAAFPLLTLGAYYKAVLAIDLRMRDVALVETASVGLRSVLTVVFAALGLGPLSFVLPLPLVYVTEGVLGYYCARDRPWRCRTSWREMCTVTVGNRWILTGTFVIAVTNNIDYLVLGRLTDLELLGVYFFAYQLTYMSAALVTENLRRVMTPALVALPDDERLTAAARAMPTYVLLGTPLLLSLAVVIDPLETAVWSGKWEDAVLPVQVLSAGLAIQLTTSMAQASVQADGRFRLWTAVNSLRAGIGAAGALLAGTVYPDDVFAIAAVMAVALGVANLVQVGVTFHRQGLAIRPLFTSVAQVVWMGPVSMLAVIALQERWQLGPVSVALASLTVFYVLCAGLAVLAARRVSVSAWVTLLSALRRRPLTVEGGRR